MDPGPGAQGAQREGPRLRDVRPPPPRRLPGLACLAFCVGVSSHDTTHARLYICRWQDGKAMCFLVDKLCGTDSPIDMQEVMNVRCFFFFFFFFFIFVRR